MRSKEKIIFIENKSLYKYIEYIILCNNDLSLHLCQLYLLLLIYLNCAILYHNSFIYAIQKSSLKPKCAQLEFVCTVMHN
jgi:hypothetical protein